MLVEQLVQQDVLESFPSQPMAEMGHSCVRTRSDMDTESHLGIDADLLFDCKGSQSAMALIETNYVEQTLKSSIQCLASPDLLSNKKRDTSQPAAFSGTNTRWYPTRK